MPKIKPKKINYMDMSIPFDAIPIPKSRKELEKLVERFDAEFGDDYEFNPWVDPADVYVKDDRGNYVLAYKTLMDVKIARIKFRKYIINRFNKAIENNDVEDIKFCNSLRELPPLTDSDNGWNIKPAMKLHYLKRD